MRTSGLTVSYSLVWLLQPRSGGEAKRKPMERSLEDSPYSHNFRLLRFLGAWVVDPRDPVRLSAYAAYKVVMTVMSFSGLFSLMVDFYMVIGDFRKMTWNLCITVLFWVGLAKNFYTFHANQTINSLRANLHRDALSKDSPADEGIQRQALRELKLIMALFYGSVMLFVPAWLATRYFSYLWGPRELPVPLRMPFELDVDDDFQYNLAFVSYALGGVAGIIFAVETEMAMFTILIQISREYRVLLKDIRMLDEVYENVFSRSEVNPWLRRQKTKALLRECSMRQQRLFEYIESFEFSYSSSLLLQMIACSVLIIVSAIQCMLESDIISVNLSYQMGYICTLVGDMFLVCWFSTRIRGQCMKVGEAAYSVHWYRMTTDIQKDIRMMIMRAQRPPKITAGKVMQMDLNTFMLLMRNIYSWLTLFQQLEFKVN